jgi:hypothetical protein
MALNPQAVEDPKISTKFAAEPPDVRKGFAFPAYLR